MKAVDLKSNCLIVVIASGYRKQLFEPFFISKIFGKNWHIHLRSSRVLKGFWFERLFYRYLTSKAQRIFISDKEGPDVLKEICTNQSKSITWFAWNDNLEIKEWSLKLFDTTPKLKMCVLFPDVFEKVSHMKIPVFEFNYPVVQKKILRKEKKYLICFLGEVDPQFELKQKQPELDAYLWDVARTHQNMLNVDTTRFKDVLPEYEQIWILKNRLRHHYITLLKKEFGEKFALVGNDWKKLGLDSMPSSYSQSTRYKIYGESLLCLDLLCKSTSSALYPRSAEIMSVSDGIIQLRSLESEKIFGNQLNHRTFENFEELKTKIYAMSKMDADEFTKLGSELRLKMTKKTFEHNMANILSNNI